MTSHFPRQGRISKVAFAAAVLCASHVWVHALPVGGVVSSGSAIISSQGVVTSIQQNTSKAAINWQSFNLASGEVIRVMQPNAASVLLNRVLSAQPSQIFGTLSANGQVFLVNPNGILFGLGSSVNTAGLVASTLSLSEGDFLAGRYQFAGDSLASVINLGTLNSDGGYVALYGAMVDNQGRIQANGGNILLSAQSSSAMMPSAVNNTGLLQAQSLENLNGTISLVAMGLNGTVQADGTLDVSGLGQGQKGGRVVLSGDQLALWDAKILASGDVAGGHVQVGTDSSVANSSQVNTRAIYMSAGSDIQSNSITQGDAGSVILKATDVARVHGQISARGGAQGGNGGLIETSADQLSVNGLRVDASAPRGQIGTWLLDPADVTISSAASSSEGLSANVFAPVAGASVANINVSELVVALNTANVTVTTQNTAASGAGQGDIDVNAVLTWTAHTTLSLNAARDVNVNHAITGTDGSLILNAGRNANILAAVTTTTGNLELAAVQDVNLSAATTITTGHLNAVAGRNVSVASASTITGGDMLLRADNDGTGPGVAGGTVSITCGLNCITLTNGTLHIRFNPASESTLPAELTAYASNLTGAAHTLDAKAWMFAKGVDKPYDANTTATLMLAGGPTGATLVPGTANFTSKDVATLRGINYSAYNALGAGVDHLLWSPEGVAAGTGTTSANITAVPLSLTASNVIKNYGQTASLTGFTAVGLLGGDTVTRVTETSSGSVPSATVDGSPYAIVPSAAEGGFVASNYNISYVNGTLTVVALPVVVPPVVVPPVVEPPVVVPPVTEPPVVVPPVVVPPVVVPPVVVPPVVEPPVVEPPVVVPPVTEPPVVTPPVIEPPVLPPVVIPPEVVPPVIGAALILPSVIEPSIALTPPKVSPVGVVFTKVVLTQPLQLLSLPPVGIVDPVRSATPVVPNLPVATKLVEIVPVTPVLLDEQPVPIKPVIRPRKQDRN
jgi:filamentous hemagglutinin family protein